MFDKLNLYLFLKLKFIKFYDVRIRFFSVKIVIINFFCFCVKNIKSCNIIISNKSLIFIIFI